VEGIVDFYLMPAFDDIAMVHEREEEVVPISIAEARGSLCRFFAFLPPTW
jgi:hypothetical protein